MKQVDLSVDKGRKNGMHITNSYRDQVELLPKYNRTSGGDTNLYTLLKSSKIPRRKLR